MMAICPQPEEYKSLEVGKVDNGKRRDNSFYQQ